MAISLGSNFFGNDPFFTQTQSGQQNIRQRQQIVGLEHHGNAHGMLATMKGMGPAASYGQQNHFPGYGFNQGYGSFNVNVPTAQGNFNSGLIVSEGPSQSKISQQGINQNQVLIIGNNPYAIGGTSYHQPPPPQKPPYTPPIPVPPPYVPPTPPPPPPVHPTPPPPSPVDNMEWPCYDQYGNVVHYFTSYDKYTGFVQDQSGQKVYYDLNQFEQVRNQLYGGYYPTGGQAEILQLIRSGYLTQIPTGQNGLPALNRPPVPAVAGQDFEYA